MTPWYSSGGVEIHVGHVLDVLAAMPAQSVQACITSPPYFGLRSYQTEPQVWGGDPLCSHALEETVPGKIITGGTGTASAKQVTNAGSQYGNAWAETVEERANGAGGNWQQAANGPQLAGAGVRTRFKGDLDAARAPTSTVAVRSATCTRCGAWRGELGSEPTPQMYVEHIVEVFRAVRRVLNGSGTIWVNLGDSYANDTKWGGATSGKHVGGPEGTEGYRQRRETSLGPKQLQMMPARVALALQSDGWVLRSDIIWAKPNPMPESVTDRPTKAHEYLFLLSKSDRYFYDAEAVREPAEYGRSIGGDMFGRVREADPRDQRENQRGTEAHSFAGGRNRRSVWTIPTESYPAAHFATYPRALVTPCILAGTSARGQCPSCGTPWRRETNTSYANPGNRTTNGQKYVGRGHETPDYAVRLEKQVETLGWEPSCKCNAGDSIPQTVLDPFAGSGTTLYVARHHGRRALGIELNESYARLAADRLKQGVLPLERA